MCDGNFFGWFNGTTEPGKVIQQHRINTACCMADFTPSIYFASLLDVAFSKATAKSDSGRVSGKLVRKADQAQSMEKERT